MNHSTTHCPQFDAEPAAEIIHPPLPVRVLPRGFSYLLHGEKPTRPESVRRGQRWLCVPGERAYVVAFIRRGIASLRLSGAQAYIRLKCATIIECADQWTYLGVER